MRRYDEPVDVVCRGPIDGAPSQFVWRNRLWRVLEIERRWTESGAWWCGPAVRAARGEDVDSRYRLDALDASSSRTATLEVADDGDLLCEQEVWRVEASCGRYQPIGVYELAHAWSAGEWMLRVVMD